MRTKISQINSHTFRVPHTVSDVYRGTIKIECHFGSLCLFVCLLNPGVMEALSLGVKRLGYEADHPPPSSAQVNKGKAVPPFPMRLHSAVLN
jgi:hypothetical protein